MAEAWLNRICGEHFSAESAGLELDPGSNVSVTPQK
jgi:protein-tyrosine-phosphatase